MAGRPRTRERRQREAEAQRKAHANGYSAPLPAYPELAAVYAQEYTSFDALRLAMIQHGIVEHGLNPYEVIQRAIDDTTTDYLLVRKRIDKDSHGDPQKLVDHPLYDHMEHMREAMVRYSTFAMQYDIAKRQLQLSETRIALLAVTLRTVLEQAGVDHDLIRKVPQLLIQELQAQQKRDDNNPSKYGGRQRFDEDKATALAEILDHNNDVVIEYDDNNEKP